MAIDLLLSDNTCKVIFDALKGDWTTGSYRISIILIYSYINQERLNFLASYLLNTFQNIREDVKVIYCGQNSIFYCVQIQMGEFPNLYAITVQDERSGRVNLGSWGPPAEDTMLIH